MNDIQLFLAGSQQLKREKTEDGFILVFAKYADGSYTLGWKKEICGSLHGDWIRIKTNEDSESVYERFKGAVIEQARVVERAIKQKRRCRPTDAKNVRKAIEQYLPAKRNLAESLRARARILEAAADLRSPAINDGSRGTAVSDPVSNAVIGSQQALRQIDANIAEYRRQMDYAEWLLSLSEDPAHKSALRLRFFEGLSVMQAAAEMKASETTIKTYVRLACETIARRAE